MRNFSIGKQIKKELEDFYSKKVYLAGVQNRESVRTLKNKDDSGYQFNQADTINTIDLLYNSKFQNGLYDKLGQRKIFLNILRFRVEVAAKQIDLDVKDFRFTPDDYADPFIALFVAKDFKDWSRETYFGELLNQLVDAFPKYGSVVVKRVKSVITRSGVELKFVPLQLLRNEQTAESLQTATYVIEDHPQMLPWEIASMPNWNTNGLLMKADKPIDVYERYGYVPRAWLKAQQRKRGMNVTTVDEDYEQWVKAVAFVTIDPESASQDKLKEHTFFAEEIKRLPYEEAHWDKQFGRWLGLGVGENLIENQDAANIVINLYRRMLHWSSKKLFQALKTEVTAKNLVMDVPDGAIIEYGPNGQIAPIDMTFKGSSDFNVVMQEFARNADQKAMTFEVATGEALPSGTPFRLGVVLSEAVNSYFRLKQEKLGLFLKRTFDEFLLDSFLRDMNSRERMVDFFASEPGYQILQQGAIAAVKSEFIRASLLTGQPVDLAGLEQVVEPYQAIDQLFFNVPKNFYKDRKFKFDLSITGEEINVQQKIETLSTAYQLAVQMGDPRAPGILEKLTQLGGETLSTIKPVVAPQPNARQPQPSQ